MRPLLGLLIALVALAIIIGVFSPGARFRLGRGLLAVLIVVFAFLLAAYFLPARWD